MANQSIKQQIANSMVQKVLQQQRDQGLAQLQADYDAWNTQQQEIAALQAEYDNWFKAQQPAQEAQPIKQATVNEVKEIPKLRNQIDLEDFFTPKTANGENINKRKPTEEALARAKVADIANRISKNIVPTEEQYNKQKAIEENKTGRRTKVYKDSVNNMVSALNSKEMKQANALADYNKNVEQKAKVDQWLSPDYKLTDKDKEAAKKYAQEELQKYDYNSNKKPILNSAEDRQHYADMVNLLNKSNAFTNAMTGVIKQPAALGRAVRDAGNSIIDQLTGLGAAIGDKTGITEGATQRHNENVALREAFNKQNDESMIRALEGAKTQNPGATTVGEIGGQIGMYALTNPAFDALGAAAGLGKAGSFALNQVGQNAQDLALDTIPMLNDYLEGGVTDEERKELLKNIGINAAGNLAMGAAGEGLSALAKNRAAKKAADAAFRSNVSEGADKLAKLADLEDVDNVVRNATRQAEEAAQNIDNIAKQMPQAPEYKPTEDELKALYEEMYQQPATREEVEALNKEMGNIWADNAAETVENATKAQRPEYDPEVQEKILSDFEEIYNSMDNMNRAAIDSGDVKALEKFEKLQQTIEDYENAIWKSGDPEEITKAKKAADAARQGFIRQMKKIDPNYKGDLTGTKLGNAEYRVPKGISDEEADELVKDWVDTELSNPNRYVEDVSKRNQVMAEDTGIEPTPEPQSVKETFEIPDTPENAPTGPKPEPQAKEPGMKVSEAYTNTGKNGGGWNEAEYNKYTDPENYQYETIDEVRSVEEATKMRATEGREAFKNRVLNEERVSSIELDGLMMEWRELTEEARALEAAGEDATKLWEESNRIFRKVQTQSTSNAQALQVLAKWSRNTPEGMLINAENIVNGKTKANKTELQKFIEKHFKNKKGEIQFSAAFEKEFLKTAESLRGLTGDALDSREAKEAMAKLGKMVNEQLPVKLNEKLQSILMDNMLGNFRTLITRNAGGNLGLNAVEQTLQRPLAAGIDSLVSLKTGKRTQAGLTKAGLAEYIQGFGKGLADEGKDFKSGLHTARSGENTLENAIRANRHVFKTKVADGLDGLVKHGLSVGDRPYYEAVYKQTLGDYQRLFDRGLLGKDIQSLSPEDFKAYSETAAKMNALGAVYQQDTMLSKALLDLKKGVGELSDGILGVDILSQFSMPFVKTPANVVERAIDYSPLGLVRNGFRTAREIGAKNFDQNRFANESARNILGTALMGGSAAYAANGGISGKYSDNKNEKQAQKEAGMQEYAWNVPEWIPALGGKQMDISWLPVVGSNAVASAAAVDAFKNGDGNFGENLTQGVEAGGKALFDQSMFQGLQRLFGTGESYNSDEGIVGNMKNVVTSGVGQAIPSLARQIAQVKDEYQRDLPYSNKGTSFGPFDTYDINSLANNIPFLRENYLAPKVDTSGNLLKENQGRNVGMKILEDMILPGKLTDVNMSPLAQEASRLSGATKSAFIPKADRSAIDTDEHTLTNEEWVLYQQDYYNKMTEAGEKLVENDFYKNTNEETQAKLLNGLYGEIKSAINSKYTGKELTGAAKVYKEQGVDAALDYMIQSQMVNDAGLSNNEKNRKLAQTGGQEALNEKAQENNAIEAAGLDINDTTRAIYNNYGDQGLNDYNYFGKYEEKSEAFNRYEYSKKSDSSMSAQRFDRIYSQIDGTGSKGNKNGSVTQDEMIDYLNQKGIKDEKTALDYWYTYGKFYADSGNWAKIPVLEKDKNGNLVWKAKTKK